MIGSCSALVWLVDVLKDDAVHAVFRLSPLRPQAVSVPHGDKMLHAHLDPGFEVHHHDGIGVQGLGFDVLHILNVAREAHSTCGAPDVPNGVGEALSLMRTPSNTCIMVRSSGCRHTSSPP